MLRLPVALAEAMLAHARAELPNEACGLLAGSPATGDATAFHPARNAAASPLRFEVDPADLVRLVLAIDAAGEELLAVFHSHTRSAAVPSPSDLRGAGFPTALHLIADMTQLRAWRANEGGWSEVEVGIG
ncbi:MAG TPA: M67 family metallopeptidase [Candidatus Limnocylindria bacterium]|nr:M67 family metallopeptidase [Candidatus Limnocylindria bacterium]